MGFRINTNIAAMNSHRNAVNTNLGLDKSLNSLSSGLRINKAADDASGMTIADSLRSQAQGLGQAINNANDGVAVIQTADGALDEYINIINTVRTKSIQAASDGQNSDSRAAIQADIDRLLEAADGIAKTTQFNGQQLLDGTFTNKSFHIGAYAGETVNLSVDSVRTDSVGDIKSTEGSETRTDLDATNLIEGATGYTLRGDQLKVNDIDVSGSINSMSPLSLTDAASVAAAITDATGLIAEGSNTLKAASAIIASTAGNMDITEDNYLKINGIAIADTTVTADDADGSLVAAINDISDQTGVTASLNADKKIELTSDDGSNIAISTRDNIDRATVTLGGGANASTSSMTIDDGTTTITIATTSNETLASIAQKYADAINANDTFLSTATVVNGVLTLEGKAAGDITITTAEDGATATTTDDNTLTNWDSKGLTGFSVDNLTDAEGANTNTIAQTTGAALVIEAGELVVNGVDMAGTYGDGSTDGTAGDALIAAIQDIDGMEDSKLTYNGKLTLTVNNGDDLNIAGSKANSTFGFNATLGNGTNGVGVQNDSKIGKVEIYSDSSVKIGGDDPAAYGFTAGTKTVLEQGTSLEDISVTSRSRAELGILIADSALKQLDATRADLGSVQNQLESTIRNISVTQVNVTAAESQIRDVDFAAESANFAKLNILAQSGSYAMSQANAVQQNVMRLLQ